MALVAGTRLGPYEIVSPLGAGGMGEVYRARDTRLDRTVAIKVLNSALDTTPDLKARFEREARAISQLNHPNICTLHDVGHDKGTDFLVMEFIEGESLADRLKKGPLPLDQLLKIGIETADALDKAHRAGIVHRDLKPGNVMLTKSGAKLLDFGLAKPAAMSALAGSGSAPLLSAAMTSPNPQASPLTTVGALVGTVQYMSPEQLQGLEADARSDIFALGAVLYEMATGKRAFEGKSQIKVASAILEDQPAPLSLVAPAAPPALEQLIRACLQKSPEDRLQSAHDVAIHLRWAAERGAATADPALAASGQRSSWLPWALLAVVAVLVAAFAGYSLLSRRPATSLRASILPPEKVDLDITGDNGGPPVICPDGSKIAFLAHLPGAKPILWVRPLNSPVAIRLDGTEDASFPFWSPDSQYIAFFANGFLSKVPAGGGPVTKLAPIGQARGGSWGANDTILYAPDYQSAIFRVSGGGGSSTAVTKVDPAIHTTHRWPWLLPDGKHFLFFATSHAGSNSAHDGIYYGTLGSGEIKMLVPTDAAGQYASGFLLYRAGGMLMAQHFDPGSGALSGSPQVAVDQVMNDAGIWRPIFSVSQNGSMIYEPGANIGHRTRLVWYDRSGKILKEVAADDDYADPRLSPDGTRLAASAGDKQSQIWVMDLARGTRARLSFDNTNDFFPSWSPDGKNVVYSTGPGAQNSVRNEIKTRPANGSGTAESAADDNSLKNYPQWSPDGRFLAFIKGNGGLGWSVWARPTAGGDAFAVVKPATPQANILSFRISPDGRWIAYVSNESGQQQLYVAPFPNGDGKWLVSPSTAAYPAWRGDSKELYYVSSDGNFYVADVSASGSEFVVHEVKVLFPVPFAPTGYPYDVTRDGQRFVFNTTSERAISPPSLIVNWTAELKK